ncbi:MAG TPA: hypothetical protein VN224_10725, partial [Xanthomonadales bacterium]|nr:hypothetical protein [Xanthomonadales bacterium]
TNSGSVLASGGASTPDFGLALVVTGGEAPGPGTNVSIGGFFGIGGDLNLDTSTGAVTPDFGIGTPGVGATATVTVPTPFSAPAISAPMCQG